MRDGSILTTIFEAPSIGAAPFRATITDAPSLPLNVTGTVLLAARGR